MLKSSQLGKGDKTSCKIGTLIPRLRSLASLTKSTYLIRAGDALNRLLPLPLLPALLFELALVGVVPCLVLRLAKHDDRVGITHNNSSRPIAEPTLQEHARLLRLSRIVEMFKAFYGTRVDPELLPLYSLTREEQRARGLELVRELLESIDGGSFKLWCSNQIVLLSFK